MYEIVSNVERGRVFVLFVAMLLVKWRRLVRFGRFVTLLSSLSIAGSLGVGVSIDWLIVEYDIRRSSRAVLDRGL